MGDEKAAPIFIGEGPAEKILYEKLHKLSQLDGALRRKSKIEFGDPDMCEFNAILYSLPDTITTEQLRKYDAYMRRKIAEHNQIESDALKEARLDIDQAEADAETARGEAETAQTNLQSMVNAINAELESIASEGNLPLLGHIPIDKVKARLGRVMDKYNV